MKQILLLQFMKNVLQLCSTFQHNVVPQANEVRSSNATELKWTERYFQFSLLAGLTSYQRHRGIAKQQSKFKPETKHFLSLTACCLVFYKTAVESFQRRGM